jgi:hypothetical protein
MTRKRLAARIDSANWGKFPWPPRRGTADVARPATPRAPATCLTKEYLQTGVVLLKDVCTKEWAMNSTTFNRPVTSVTARDCLTKENLGNGMLERGRNRDHAPIGLGRRNTRLERRTPETSRQVPAVRTSGFLGCRN